MREDKQIKYLLYKIDYDFKSQTVGKQKIMGNVQKCVHWEFQWV